MRIKLDEKQLETLKAMLDRVVRVAERIAEEMKRFNDQKEKDQRGKEA